MTMSQGTSSSSSASSTYTQIASTTNGSIPESASQTSLDDDERIDSSHADPFSSQTTRPGKLSSEDFVELTRISRKKVDIEHYIQSLQSWPAWDPFKDVSSYSANLTALERSDSILATLSANLSDRQSQCSRLEHDVRQFNLEDMQRLRTVAKAVSKRHLSGPDTDLLELALETVYALDKLLRLLRERRAEHDLTELRLQWEETVCASWRDVVVLRRDIAAFEHKCQAIMSTRFDQQATARTIQAQQASSDTRQSSSKGRVASATLASLKLAAESVKLESSRLTLRIRSFDTEKVRHASRTLDLLIDQRQVPEHLIDEQEKLEDALPQPSVIEAKSSEVTSFLGNAALTAANASQNRVQLQSEPPVRTSSPSKTEGVVSGRDQHLNGLSSSTDDVANASATARTMSRSLQTGTRSRKTSSASLSATPNKHSSNGYRPNPRNALDVAVGDIVNRMPMTIAIKSANLADISYAQQSAAGKDLSGQYWIGDPEPRLCFCRILPSSMVMVRVGGGWQELSEFLTQHYAHLSARGLHPGDVSPSVSSAGVAANVAWLRSASGPAGSSRLRSKSSVGSLRSHEPARLFTPQQPSRIVTMPTMKRRNSLLAHTVEPIAMIIPTPTQTAIDRTQAGSSSPLQESELPASGSGSSIIIHPSSPSA